MKLVIDTDKLKDCDIGVSLQEIMMLFIINDASEKFLLDIIKSLSNKGLIVTDYDSEKKQMFYTLRKEGVEKLEQVLANSQVSKTDSGSKDRFVALAKKLMALYPTGRKPGTSLAWRGNTLDVSSKLKSLYTRNIRFTDEQAVDAVRRYVSSFGDDTTYMAVLKYFICKRVIEDGVSVIKSDFLSYIQNDDMESENEIAEQEIKEMIR